ncbi:MAG: DivIVA domain-containing protein [Stackebrandtia sp.]
MEFVLVLVALVLAGGIAFGIVVLVTGNDPGLASTPGDGLPDDLPADRPLSEVDVLQTRFDTGARGYRTTQVDQALARVAYDVGFKDELIKVLASEVSALRDGRADDADALRDVRRRALGDAANSSAGRDTPVDVGSASGASTEAGETDGAEAGEAEAGSVGEGADEPSGTGPPDHDSAGPAGAQPPNRRDRDDSTEKDER